MNLQHTCRYMLSSDTPTFINQFLQALGRYHHEGQSRDARCLIFAVANLRADVGIPTPAFTLRLGVCFGSPALEREPKSPHRLILGALGNPELTYVEDAAGAAVEYTASTYEATCSPGADYTAIPRLL